VHKGNVMHARGLKPVTSEWAELLRT